MDARMGNNINGPSLIRVPEWVRDPLGPYYLYFAHHQGTYIRLAYADRPQGPWRLHTPGALELSDSFFTSHVASPDVHVLHDRQEIRMYYHGCCLPEPPFQFTRLATSADGLNFTANEALLGASYWRAFRWKDFWYTLEMPGVFRRSPDGISDFEEGPTLFTPDMRHAAVRLSGDILTIFYSNAHDCPERILWSKIHLMDDWNRWQAGAPETLLAAEMDYEGADCPIERSERGSVHERVHQLRDPCIFDDGAQTYILYSIAGESGIAMAELFLD